LQNNELESFVATAMASTVLHNVSNRLEDTAKAAKKKVKGGAGKKLDTPAAGASKDASGINTPRDVGDDGADGSGENQHIREVQK
jgi:hypothetical protein